MSSTQISRTHCFPAAVSMLLEWEIRQDWAFNWSCNSAVLTLTLVDCNLWRGRKPSKLSWSLPILPFNYMFMILNFCICSLRPKEKNGWFHSPYNLHCLQNSQISQPIDLCLACNLYCILGSQAWQGEKGRFYHMPWVTHVPFIPARMLSLTSFKYQSPNSRHPSLRWLSWKHLWYKLLYQSGSQ